MQCEESTVVLQKAYDKTMIVHGMKALLIKIGA